MSVARQTTPWPWWYASYSWIFFLITRLGAAWFNLSLFVNFTFLKNCQWSILFMTFIVINNILYVMTMLLWICFKMNNLFELCKLMGVLNRTVYRHWKNCVCHWNIYRFILPWKAKRQYLPTLQVRRYCLLALQDSMIPWSREMDWEPELHWRQCTANTGYCTYRLTNRPWWHSTRWLK